MWVSEVVVLAGADFSLLKNLPSTRYVGNDLVVKRDCSIREETGLNAFDLKPIQTFDQLERRKTLRPVFSCLSLSSTRRQVASIWSNAGYCRCGASQILLQQKWAGIPCPLFPRTAAHLRTA
jgi:hypothetical protein